MEEYVLHLVVDTSGLAKRVAVHVHRPRVVPLLLLPGLKGLMRNQIIPGVLLVLSKLQIGGEQHPFIINVIVRYSVVVTLFGIVLCP